MQKLYIYDRIDEKGRFCGFEVRHTRPKYRGASHLYSAAGMLEALSGKKPKEYIKTILDEMYPDKGASHAPDYVARTK